MKVCVSWIVVVVVKLVTGQRNTVELTHNVNPIEKTFYETVVEIPATEKGSPEKGSLTLTPFSTVSNMAISSNVPVTLLKYRSNYEATRIINRNDAVIFLKSACDDPDDVLSDPSIEIRVETDALSGEARLVINVVDELAKAKEQQELLPVSSFAAKYNRTNYMCSGMCHEEHQVVAIPEMSGEPLTQIIQDATVNVESHDSIKSTDIVEESGIALEGENFIDKYLGDFHVVFPFMTETEYNQSDKPEPESEEVRAGLIKGIIKNLKERKQDKQCLITAEIIIDSCSHSVTVTAPLLQVYDNAHTNEIDSVRIGDDCFDKCIFSTTSVLSYPDDAVVTTKTKVHTFPVKATDTTKCHTAMDGRPFTNAQGNIVASMAIVSDTAVWGVPSDEDATPAAARTNDYSALGSDWTDRALGEHASVASFASFTIALMTNGAPPSLIKDSLLAALDEVNHATTSFRMASLLTELKIEPDPLPESTLHFQRDRAGLALKVLKEGCIDETISALLAAHQVDLEGEHTVGMKHMLHEKTRIIAKEEARHSSLAWRTVHWLCDCEDQDACHVAQSYLHDKAHEHVSNRIKGNRPVEVEWARIFHTLVPVVTSDDTDLLNINKVLDSHLLRSYKTEQRTFVQEIADLIVEGVTIELSFKEVVSDETAEI